LTVKAGGGNRDIFDDVFSSIAKVRDEITKVRRSLKIPTIPVYDSTTFPDAAQRGQIARDINDPAVLWVYAEDDTWYQIGGGTADLPTYVARSTSPVFVTGDWTTLTPDTSSQTPDTPFAFASPSGSSSCRFVLGGAYFVSVKVTNNLILNPPSGSSPGAADYWAAGRALEVTVLDNVGSSLPYRVVSGGEGSRKSLYLLRTIDGAHLPAIITGQHLSMQNTYRTDPGHPVDEIAESDTMEIAFIVNVGAPLPANLRVRVIDDLLATWDQSSAWTLTDVTAIRLSSKSIGI
jgi:hypothetical protein